MEEERKDGVAYQLTPKGLLLISFGGYKNGTNKIIDEAVEKIADNLERNNLYIGVREHRLVFIPILELKLENPFYKKIVSLMASCNYIKLNGSENQPNKITAYFARRYNDFMSFVSKSHKEVVFDILDNVQK